MEGNLASGNMNSGSSEFGNLDLQGSMGVKNHHQHPHDLHTSKPELFLSTMRQNHECEQPNSMANYNPQAERGNDMRSDDEEMNFNGEEMDGQNDLNKGNINNNTNSNSNNNNNNLLWHRVKWTDPMIRLLIMALSYVGDDAISEGFQGGRRKYINLQKKGKWKTISKVMTERGFCVSPQQCEDKYNDLNKRYKKLNDILGRGTSCEVVENPARLDMLDHLSEKAKDEVRKILSSKHLFYEEMCSYHNRNRLHLPHDPALQRSLQLALRSKDDRANDSMRHSHNDDDDDVVVDDDDYDNDDDDDDEEDHDAETDDHEEYEDIHRRSGCGVHGDSAKRIKQGKGGLDDFSFGNPQPITVQLEEQRLQIQLEMLDLEKQRLKWQLYSKKKDRELEMMRMENDRMRLENERMALKLKRTELAVKCHP